MAVYDPIKRKICAAHEGRPCQFVRYEDVLVRKDKTLAADGKPLGAGSGRFGSYYPDFSESERARLDAIIENYDKK